jgi:hypothetical protein
LSGQAFDDSALDSALELKGWLEHELCHAGTKKAGVYRSTGTERQSYSCHLTHSLTAGLRRGETGTGRCRQRPKPCTAERSFGRLSYVACHDCASGGAAERPTPRRPAVGREVAGGHMCKSARHCPALADAQSSACWLAPGDLVVEARDFRAHPLGRAAVIGRLQPSRCPSSARKFLEAVRSGLSASRTRGRGPNRDLRWAPNRDLR